MNFLITGANRGIGLELTRLALEAGARVFALTRKVAEASDLKALTQRHVERCKVIECDITVFSELQRVQAAMAGETLDVLINNAGVLLDSGVSFEKLTPELVNQSFAVNSVAPIFVARAFLKNLKNSKHPKLVNITSLMGSVADNTSGGYYAYRMSKSALNMFGKSFAIDHPEIIVLSLHPGWVRTRMGGSQAPLTTEDSAKGLFAVISSAEKKDSGQFFNYKGERLPW